MPIVSLENVSKRYPSPQRAGDQVTAVDDVTLHIEKGDVYGIIGYSGAGKSTLVRLINALEPATEGRITVDDVEVTALSERELRAVRTGIGMIFQQFNLFHSRTVYGNVEYPLIVAGVPKEKRHARVAELLTFVGLADKAHAHPEQLSGGQKQRVGIARALATGPSILLADEATSALDPETTVDVLNLLRRVNAELGVTIVVITHEMEVVRSLADRIVVMEQGRIVETDGAFEIFARPRHPVTQRFVRTLIDDVPDDHTTTALRERHSGRLVTLSFRDESVSQSQVFAEIIGRGVEFELVHGGVEHVRGRAFGHLTVELRGDAAMVEEAVTAVRALVETTEVA